MDIDYIDWDIFNDIFDVPSPLNDAPMDCTSPALRRD